MIMFFRHRQNQVVRQKLSIILFPISVFIFMLSIKLSMATAKKKKKKKQKKPQKRSTFVTLY